MQLTKDENQQIYQDLAQSIPSQNQDIHQTPDPSVNPVSSDIKPEATIFLKIMKTVSSLLPLLLIGGIYLLAKGKHGGTHETVAKILIVSIIIICLITTLYGGFVKKSLFIATGRYGSYSPTGVFAEIIAVISAVLYLAGIVIVLKLR